MLFTSLEFIIFATFFVIAYYCAPKKIQWYVLLAASLMFYALLGRKRLIFILLSSISTWLAANVLGKMLATEKQALAEMKERASKAEKTFLKSKNKAKRQVVLWGFLAFNFGILFFFKFYGAASESLSFLPKINLLMPIGISFYTLQIVGYVIDVYNKKVQPEKSILKTILFTTFFPQIIEGPISRFSQLEPQLCASRSFDYNQFCLGLQRMLWGYFKKLIIADRLHIAVATVFDNYQNYHGFEIAVAAIFYTIQLYADFSGGIDIACGVGEVFGVHFVENFKRPFFSKSVSEFWRRWHITLGSWLRDYVFYPLTLSKPLAKFGKWCTKHLGKWAGKWLPAYLSLFVLWLCNGIWHGDGMQYIVFGLYHGTLIMLGMTFAPLLQKLYAALHLNTQSFFWKVICISRTFLLVCFGEMIFRAQSFSAAVQMAENLFAVWNPAILWNGTIVTWGLSIPELCVAFIAILVLFCVSYAGRTTSMCVWVRTRRTSLRWTILLGGIFSIVLFGIYGPSYDPTPFIYFQF